MMKSALFLVLPNLVEIIWHRVTEEGSSARHVITLLYSWHESIHRFSKRSSNENAPLRLSASTPDSYLVRC